MKGATTENTTDYSWKTSKNRWKFIFLVKTLGASKCFSETVGAKPKTMEENPWKCCWIKKKAPMTEHELLWYNSRKAADFHQGSDKVKAKNLLWKVCVFPVKFLVKSNPKEKQSGGNEVKSLGFRGPFQGAKTGPQILLFWKVLFDWITRHAVGPEEPQWRGPKKDKVQNFDRYFGPLDG